MSVGRDSSVEYYAVLTAEIKVPFVHGVVDCYHCSYCRQRKGFNNYTCDLIWRSVIDGCDLDRRHPDCPVRLEKTEF